MSQISIAHTPCKNCVFANYKDITQIGCHMGLIEKYQEQGIEILEAYDEEKEFYIVNNKKCFAHKEPNYFKSRNMEDASLEEKIKYVSSIMQMSYLAAIDCRNRDPEELHQIIQDDLLSSVVKPKVIMCVIGEAKAKYSTEYYKVLDSSGCKWKLKLLSCEEQDHITTVHQSINVGAERCGFVLSIGENKDKIKELIALANETVYEKFSSFSVISNESKETILFNVQLYKASLFAKKDIITDYERYTIV